MYFATVILLLFVFPVTSMAIETMRAPHLLGFMPLLGKWFVFWGAGIRLFIAGARQVIQPRFTAEEIFRIQGSAPFAIVRELGFANLSMGTLATCSLFHSSWIEPAAIAGGLYYGLAGIGHIGQAGKNAREYLAMISDGFMFLVLSGFLISELL